jgi:hypothetical protein
MSYKGQPERGEKCYNTFHKTYIIHTFSNDYELYKVLSQEKKELK